MILAVYVYDVQNLSRMHSSMQHGSAFFDLNLPTALRNGHTMQNGRVKGGVSGVFFKRLTCLTSPHGPAASIHESAQGKKTSVSVAFKDI